MKKKKLVLSCVKVIGIAILTGGCSFFPLGPAGPVPAEIAFEILDGARECFDKAKSQGKDDAEAIAITVDWLRTRPEVRSAAVTSDPTIAEFTLRDGTPGMFFGGAGWSESTTQSESGALDVGKQHLTFTLNIPQSAPPRIKRALIFDPFPEFFDLTPRNVKTLLEGIGYTVVHVAREQANLEELKRMNQYGVIIAATHGGLRSGQVILLTGEKVTPENWEAYTALRMAGKIGYSGHATQWLSRGTKWWFVTPKFFEDIPNIPRALFYAHACYSLANDTMARALQEKGVATYCGWLIERNIILDMRVPQRFFQALCSGKTVADADATDGSPWTTYYGDGNLILIGPPTITAVQAINIASTSATLAAVVNPNGLATSVYFEWGTTSVYDNRSPVQSIGNGTTPVSISTDLVSLLPNTVYYFRVVAVNSAGTTYENGAPFKTVRLPGPVDIFWEYKSPMPTPRWGMNAAVVEGKIYLIGGSHGTMAYNSENEVYDPLTDAWVTKHSMTTAREKYAIGVVEGKIYIIGGSYPGTVQTNVVEMYDPTTDTWVTKTPMPTSRHYCTAAVVGRKIYVIGGGDRNALDIVEVYDTETDTWASVTRLPRPRTFLTGCTAVVDGKIYVIGGWSTTGMTDVVDIYDPVTNTWSIGNPIPTPRIEATIVVLNDLVYVIGGSTMTGEICSIVEVYDPHIDMWFEASPINSPRCYSASAAVNGRLYNFGGYYYGQALDVVEKGTPIF